MAIQSTRGFTERVALVVGGAHGVGRAVALQLALAGTYTIINHTAEDEAGARVAGELREMGTLADVVEADTVRSDDVARLFARIDALYGRLDLLVNCATRGVQIALDDVSEASWDETIARDLKSAFLCSQAAAKFLRARPSPAIVNVADASALTGRGAGAHTVAAHAGLIGLTRATAHELAPRVRVNCVVVGRTDKPRSMLDRVLMSEGEDQSAAAERRAPAADEIARAVLYLLSPEARLISGQIITVGDEV